MRPTAHAELNAVLARLLEGVQATLGKGFSGLYLHGSLALGDFDPHSSDVDFLVVTTDPLSEAETRAIEAIHAGLTKSGDAWALKLEGSYLPRQALGRYKPEAGPWPQVNGGHFFLAPHGADWVFQRRILREQGVVVAGPDLHDLIDPVSAQDLCDAVPKWLAGWWAPMRADPARLADAEYRAYAVLTMCRALRTLETGTIASKPASARWCADRFEAWRPLIDQARAWSPGRDMADARAVCDLIGHVIERAERGPQHDHHHRADNPAALAGGR